MSRPTSPQYEKTAQGHSWFWEEPEGIPDIETGKQTWRQVELEWLTQKEVWKVRSRVNRAGWTDARVVGSDPYEEPIPDPESQDHADQLARDYADRPRGGMT